MFEGDRLLRVPGPTPVPDRVVRAGSRPMLYHRGAEFVAIFERSVARLKKLFETEGDVFILAGSGTLAMESAVANLVAPGDEAIVASGGKFGERWVELVQSFGGRPVVVSYPYGRGVEPQQIAEAMERHPAAKVVFATQNESSTTVLNDIESIARVVRDRGGILAVDAVSSLGGAPLEMDAWGVDVVVSGSQKCLMLPPGLSFVAVNQRAWERSLAVNASRYYADWRRYREAQAKGQTPYTPAVSLIVALDEALAMLEEEGKEARLARHRLMMTMVREGLKALGFDLYVEDRWASPTVTAATGGGVDPSQLVKAVKARTGVVLSGGQGELKGKIFRVGHMGAVTPLDMATTLSAIELGMAALGKAPRLGAGVARALEVWSAWA